MTTTDSTATWTSLGAVGNFTGGQAPHARLANACATNWFAAGNTSLCRRQPRRKSGDGDYDCAGGSTATVGKIVCHNHSGSYPPAASDLSDGATISTTAAAVYHVHSISGGHIYLRIGLQAGVGVSAGVASII